jgi:urea-proton symporter
MALPFGPWVALVFIAVATICSTVISFAFQARYYRIVPLTFDYFATVGRAAPMWLVRSSVVNSWIWPATILISSQVGFEYGLSGPLWYAVGASVQLLVLAFLADRVQRSPYPVRSFDYFRIRFDGRSHRTLVAYALTTSLLVCCLATEGAAIVLAAFTGIDVRIAALLVPLTFTLYTAISGLALTLATDLIYLIVTLVGIAVLVPMIYRHIDVDQIYASLGAFAPQRHMLVLISPQGLLFGVINFVSQLGTVLVDQTYWQRAIASRRGEARRSFVSSGLLWLPIPLVVGTALGVVGAAMHLHAAGPNAIAPVTVATLLGVPGALLFLVIMMAVVLSTGDSTILAAATLVATDLYRPGQVNAATDRKRLRVARLAAGACGIVVAALTVLLLSLRLPMSWLFMAIGIFVSSAAPTVIFGVVWQRMTSGAAFWSTIGGSGAGIVAWILATFLYARHLDLAASNQLEPMFVGNLAAIGVSVTLAVVLGIGSRAAGAPAARGFSELRDPA